MYKFSHLDPIMNLELEEGGVWYMILNKSQDFLSFLPHGYPVEVLGDVTFLQTELLYLLVA